MLYSVTHPVVIYGLNWTFKKNLTTEYMWSTVRVAFCFGYNYMYYNLIDCSLFKSLFDKMILDS